MSTYFIRYKDFYRSISYAELGKLQTIAKYDKQLEVLINQFAGSYNIKPETMRRY